MDLMESLLKHQLETFLSLFKFPLWRCSLHRKKLWTLESLGSPETPEVLNVTEPVPKILSTPLDLPTQLEKELFGSISDTEESSESTQKSWSMSADELADDLAKEFQIWDDAKDKADKEAGLKTYCPRWRGIPTLRLSVLLSQLERLQREKLWL